jgi:hypothetical protein
MRLSFPGRELAELAAATLRGEGYSVDFQPGDSISVVIRVTTGEVREPHEVTLARMNKVADAYAGALLGFGGIASVSLRPLIDQTAL